MTIAEILEEGERQIANYQTMILPHGDARTLLAVCRAAVEWDASEAGVQAAAKDPGGGRFYRATGIRWQCKTALRAAVRGDAGGKG